MAKEKPNLRIGKRRVKGEPWVWLSGGAVATGIAAHRSIDERRIVAMSDVLPKGW